MNWEVFTELSRLPTQAHWLVAIAAFALGLWILIATKGTRRHVRLGRLWLALMTVVSLSAMFVKNNDPESPIYMAYGFSFIHLLVPFTLLMLYLGVKAIRSGNVTAHRYIMISTFLGSLVLAGALTFLPGRHMHSLFFADELTIQKKIEAGVKK